MELDALWKIAIAAAVVLWVLWRYKTATQRERAARAGMLDVVTPAIERATATWSPWRYPRIEGLLDGCPVRVDLIPDTLVTRSLPTLWLQMRWVQPYDGHLCVTVNPVGAEFFSEDAECGRLVPAPAAWEARTVIRADAGGDASLRRLSALEFEPSTSVRQLSVLPGELKLTMFCTRGERTMYRVLRAAQFPPDAVSEAVVDEMLSVARMARDALAGQSQKEAG